MSEEDTASHRRRESDRNKSLRFVVDAIGAVLFTITGFLGNDLYKARQDHQDRIVKLETQQDARDKSMENLAREIHEIRVKLEQFLENRKP